ncbi:glycosyltransferase family 2 protein [Flavobacterium sp. SUN052]|uniref:glycosyltransferase family 2 protein n=1 Tax=Flavobacterium sp. SUN052 TaxID=3002441 RepID=UPI00237ECD4A|nr:glycosyltransferase family 2 protein [Flavobacterium sp. SUN052]MEC4004013.1 glycosyltransferase family 2 protein [Flavobacterium sp. SUN052]
MSNYENKIKISALAITYNEENNIKKYIESLSFADEIIIVDSNSTDNTKKITEEMGVKVICRAFDDFSNQRNFAIKQAKNDWIVFFDLDEEITTDLKNEIIEAAFNPNDVVAFYVKRNFFLFNKHLKHGGFKNDKAIRLFNKNFCLYNGNLVHEEIKTDGKIGYLKNSLNHYSYKNFEHYCNKLNHYCKLQSIKLHKKNTKPTIYHFTIRPLFRFISQYFIKLGFLDGKEGFLSAGINSAFVFKRYIKLWILQKEIE